MFFLTNNLNYLFHVNFPFGNIKSLFANFHQIERNQIYLGAKNDALFFIWKSERNEKEKDNNMVIVVAKQVWRLVKQFKTIHTKGKADIFLF